MRIICSYCRKGMGKKEPFEDKRVSHSMCPECYDYFSEQMHGMSLDKYLDRFDTPIIIVNATGRIVALNQMAEDMTGKSRHEVIGLLGGEAMECAYARLPEGCGKTVHCETCTIRRTVMAAMESGKKQLHVPVQLQKVNQKITMVISTDKIGDLVRIVIEKVN